MLSTSKPYRQILGKQSINAYFRSEICIFWVGVGVRTGNFKFSKLAWNFNETFKESFTKFHKVSESFTKFQKKRKSKKKLAPHNIPPWRLGFLYENSSNLKFRFYWILKKRNFHNSEFLGNFVMKFHEISSQSFTETLWESFYWNFRSLVAALLSPGWVFGVQLDSLKKWDSPKTLNRE